MERQLVTCTDRVKHIYPKNVYEPRETVFEKLDAFNILYRNEQKLFKNLAIFDYESICVKEDSYKQTETTTLIGKHVPISVCISSNLIPEPIFLCNANPHHLISSFFTALEGLATQSKAQMKLNFIEVESAIKIKLCAVLEQFNQRCNRAERVPNYVDDCIVEEEKKDLSTQFLQMQTNQLIDLQEHFERYCNVLPVFGFNNAKNDINLIKSCLLPILVNERGIQPTVIKKANHLDSFKFGDIQLLDIMNFLGGPTSLDSFLKDYKTKETKGFFPYEWFDWTEEMNNKELPPYDSFFNIQRNNNPLEKEYNDFQNLVKSGLTPKQAVVKYRMARIPSTAAENYSYLQSIWVSEGMKSFKDFLMWYKNKDVLPTLEAMQKMIEFYLQKEIDMLNLGCTLPTLAIICLHKPTDSKFCLFTESDKDLSENIREDMVGGPSIVFTRKAVVDETFIRKSTNVCKSIVSIDVSQLYPYSMCQPMPNELYTRWNYDTESQKFIPRQNKTRSFENMVLSYFQQTRPQCKIESNVTTGRQKKIDCFSVDGICYHCNTVFEAMGFYYHYCPCQEARSSLTDNEITRWIKKREQDQMRKEYIQQKGYKIFEMWESKWWESYRTDATVKNHFRANFPYRRPLNEERLMQQIKSGSLFGYVQCDLKVTEHLKAYFANFPPIFKNTVVSRNDIGDLMKEYAEKEGIMSQPRRMLISSFHLNNGTIITPLLLFYLHPGLECTKIHQFVQYTPKKCFNSFVQSAVNDRRQGDENLISSVVAETMKFLANSSSGYQIKDRSRHTVTKYLNDEKIHSAINKKLLKRLNFITDQLYEVELVKSEIEPREPIIVGFFILQYAKLRILELYYKFFKSFAVPKSMKSLKWIPTPFT